MKDYRNISNFFVETYDVSADLNEVLSKMNDSIFGVELEMTEGVVNRLIIAPPYVRLREHNAVRFRECPTSDFTAYEGYLSRPFFLPLYEGLRGELLDDIADIALPGKDKLCMQWLFRRREDWKEKALEMYSSYLEGNDHPTTFRIGRVLQDKALGVLNRIAPFTPNQYLDEVEEKILGDGFQFQVRVAIRSNQERRIMQEISDIFKKYDAHNALRLSRDKNKHFPTLYEQCILTAGTSDQIISTSELSSLIGGTAVAPHPTVIQPVAQERHVHNVLELLPMYPREIVRADDSLTEQIAGALKRVGLTRQARLYNDTITAGIRLTVVQVDIPKGKNLSHLVSKSKDIQAALGLPSLGIEQGDTPDSVKFVIPNDSPALISLREMLELESFQQFARENPLAFVVGVDEINNPLFLSLAKLVHLLVAGTTGSGKSVFINSLIIALMTSYPPEMLQFLMIDPKEVELSQYADFPHVDRVITDMDEAYGVLGELVEEMDRRYTTFRESGTKNITLYNKKAEKPMPYIVCVVDEYADLRDTHKEVEDHIARIGQKARAAGIHLVIATQRPSSDIISGRIKSNVLNAISFNLSNNNNYKTVFGKGIPYKLLGRGDGVMKIEGSTKEFQRFQSAIISPDESKEEEIYHNLAEYYSGNGVDKEREDSVHEEDDIAPVLPQQDEDVATDESSMDELDHELLYKLRQIIADTKETRVEHLRKQLGIKTAKMRVLMQALTQEGWLFKHVEKSKGYQLTATDSMLSEWKTKPE